MKKIIPFILTAMVLIFSACTDENAVDPTADARDKFVRNWNCKELCEGQITYYNSNITNDPNNTSQVLIYNLYSLGTINFAKATVAGNSISIPQQTVDVFSVSGSGTFTADKIEFNYVVNDGSSNTTVSATYSPL